MSNQRHNQSLEELVSNHRDVTPSADFIERTLRAAESLPQDTPDHGTLPGSVVKPGKVSWLSWASMAAAAAVVVSMTVSSLTTGPSAPIVVENQPQPAVVEEINATSIIASAESLAERETLQLLLALEDPETLHDDDILAFAL